MFKLNKLLFKLNVIVATFLFTFSLTACARNLVFSYRLVDKELLPYTESYWGLIKEHCKNGKYNNTDRYVIEIVDNMDNETWIGVCSVMINGFHIQLKKDWWDAATEEQKLELMYHEMAHCLIDREHINDVTHYMNPYFNTLPKQTYTNQAIEDIKNHCNE